MSDQPVSDQALHRENTGLVVQFLDHVLAEALHRLATATGGVMRLMVERPSQQVRRQRLAVGRLSVLASRFSELQCLDLSGQRSQVSVQRFLDQARLLAVEGLGLGLELQPLDHRHLVRELVDGRLLKGDLAVTALHLAGQRPRQFAQLLIIQAVQAGFVDHEA